MIRMVVLCLALLSGGLLHAQEPGEADLPTRLKALKVPAGKPFTLVVHLQVKKGEEKTMQAAARACIAETRKEPGCIRYELHQDLEDPTRFIFLERFKSVKALEEHIAADHTQKLLATVGRIVEGPPKIHLAFHIDDQ